MKITMEKYFFNSIFVMAIGFSFLNVNTVSAQTQCRSSVKSTSQVKPRSLRDLHAEELATIIAVDPETQKLISDPRIAQYLY
ncbi:MAG: hypothetical protein ACK5V3_00330 [Bdellovibrionales bacterium]